MTCETKNMDSGYTEQIDARFGKRGRGAWVYWVWPIGALPGSVIVGGLAVDAVRSGMPTAAVGFFIAVLVVLVWLCAMGMLVSLEGVRAIQHAEFDNARIRLTTFFFRSVDITRDEPVVVTKYQVPRGRLFMSMGATLLSTRTQNWKIEVPKKGIYFMNGEYFDPGEMFVRAGTEAYE